LHVQNAKEEIIRQQKIKEQRRINWSLKNIVDFVGLIWFTKRQNKPNLTPVSFYVLWCGVAGQ